MKLKVSYSCKISGRGAAVFFVTEPKPPLQWCHHEVKIKTPDGKTYETIGAVEFARKVPPGEVQALFFPDFNESDIPAGSEITILRTIGSKESNNN